jgi:hypothetical protein
MANDVPRPGSQSPPPDPTVGDPQSAARRRGPPVADPIGKAGCLAPPGPARRFVKSSRGDHVRGPANAALPGLRASGTVHPLSEGDLDNG